MTAGHWFVFWHPGIYLGYDILDWRNIDGHGRLLYLCSNDNDSFCDLETRKDASDGL